jgi:hypothetical protein
MVEMLEDRLMAMELEFAQGDLDDGVRCLERQRELVSRLEREMREARRLLLEFERSVALHTAIRDRIVFKLRERIAQ